MKKNLLLFVLAAFCFISTSNASHIAGMYITYEHTGTGNDYLFKVKYVRDCYSIAAPISVLIQHSSTTCALNFTSILNMTSSNLIPLNACSGIGTSACVGGSFMGFEEYHYEGIVNVPPCVDWVVSTDICCWSHDVTNIVNPDFYAMYVETRFDNLNFPGNSSPGFNTVPTNYYCVGNPSVRDYSAYDIDGDSLRYELVPLLTVPAMTVPMAPGLTFDQPISAFVPTYLDSLNGMLLFTASTIQIAAIGIKVSEYRNGILIGTVLVDDEVLVTSGIANPDTITGRVYIDYNLNGIYDIGDSAVSNVVLELSPANLYSTTVADGKYEFYTIDGIYDISVTNPILYTTALPASINVNTNGITSSNNTDFSLQLIPNSEDLEVHINALNNPIPGQNYSMQITCKNPGTTTQTNVTVTLNLASLLQYSSATPVPSNIAGNTLTWIIPSMGPFSNEDIFIHTTVDSTANIGASVNCTTTITPVVNDLTPNNNSDVLNDHVIASYDPNYKEVYPAGNIQLPSIVSQDWINYTIHFQNLGSAPAQIVRISDLLDLDLEFSSLELITSSFPCTMTLTNANELEFTFFGINLPAASVNEPASHGFVEYRIRPKATLLPGMYITNNAGIYFDFNAPVNTNLVQSLVVNNVGISESPASKDQISVYPNPASDYFTLELFSTDIRTIEIEIFNVIGSLVKKIDQKLSIGINQLTIPTTDLPSGAYFVSVQGNKGRVVSKLSVVRD